MYLTNIDRLMANTMIIRYLEQTYLGKASGAYLWHLDGIILSTSNAVHQDGL